ncbi:MAG: hypothetical protein M3Z46_10205 [Actinomycetota bacterium]|nr:hypothetical protein [Actinomycetota bacterium]
MNDDAPDPERLVVGVCCCADPVVGVAATGGFAPGDDAPPGRCGVGREGAWLGADDPTVRAEWDDES